MALSAEKWKHFSLWDGYDKNCTLCFTGHRPEKIPNLSEQEDKIKDWLKSEIHLAIESGYHTFLYGGARGIDLWAAQIVSDYKQNNSDMHLILVAPSKSQTRRFDSADLEQYQNILSATDHTIYIDTLTDRDKKLPFAALCHMRNEFMVDHSSYLIGVVHQQKSGSGMTIRYAEKQGILTSVLNLNEEEQNQLRFDF